MTIYDSSGKAIYTAPVTKDAIISNTLMEGHYIELSFNVIDVVPFGRGCYILHNGNKFEIMSNVHPEPLSSGNGYHYTLRFESQQSQMKRCNVFWRDGENLEVSFALTSDISTFGQLIIDNVNAFLGGSHFSLGSVPSGTEMKAISFAGDSCWDAVATIAETFGVEWWTDENGDKVRLCFGKLEIGESIEFKEGDIVSSMPSKNGDDANYGTRFYVFGSTKNLPSDYGSTEAGGITNHVVEKRLHLPDGQQYIDAWPNLAPEDIVERTVFFDDVMPTNVETITEVYSGNAEVIPGTSHKIYDVVCANSPFSLEDVIEGQTIQANFTSGSLIGQTFDIRLYQTSGEFNKRFGIVPKILDKDSLTILPQGEMIPRVGDTFILLNVNLPKARVTEAEQQLLEVGKDYVKKNSSDTDVYDCPTNAVYCHEHNSNFVLGQRVTLVGEQFGTSGRESRIQGYEKKLYDEYQATYTVGDNSPYSRLASLEKAIKKSSYGDRVGLEANIIRSKNDSTTPSDYNVYSALMAEKLFFSRERGGIVKGHTNFENGISMYGIPFGYDSKTKSWLLEGNLIVTGGGAFHAELGDLDVPTIMDALVTDEQSISKAGDTLKVLWQNLPIDGKTIKRNADGTLSAIGGGSGGGSAEVTYDSVISALGYTPLSTAGGTIVATGRRQLSLQSSTDTQAALWLGTGLEQFSKGGFLQYDYSNGSIALVNFSAMANSYTGLAGLFIKRDNRITVGDANLSAEYDILHTGNIGQYALQTTGGTVNGAFRLFRSADNPPLIHSIVHYSYSPYGLLTRINSNGSVSLQAQREANDKECFNLLLNPLGGNVAIGGTTATVRLDVIASSGWCTSFKNTNAAVSTSHADGYGMIITSTMPTTSSGYLFRVWQGSLTGASGTGTAIFDVMANNSVIARANFLATGGITAHYTSDERLKTNLRPINAGKMILSLGRVREFEYIDSEIERNSLYKGSHIGLIYQDVKGSALSKMCFDREDGYGSLNYLDTSLTALLVGVAQEHEIRLTEDERELQAVKEENKALRKEIEYLKQRVA